MQLYALAIHELHDLLIRKEVSATEVVSAFLARIEKLDPKLDSYLTLLADPAIQDWPDNSIRGQGMFVFLRSPPSLSPSRMYSVCREHGPPDTARILERFVPPYECTVGGKLREAGAIILGKTNMDEFAMGTSTENSAIRSPKPLGPEEFRGAQRGGPRRRGRRLCAVSLGSDTGGSIRQPASFCGVVGLKADLWFSFPLRSGGFRLFARPDRSLIEAVEDTAILLRASPADPRTRLSVDQSSGLSSGAEGAQKGIRLGNPKENFVDGMDPVVTPAVRKAI